MQGLHRDERGQGEETTLRAVGSKIDDRQLKEIGVTTPGLKYAFLSRCHALGDAGLQGFLRVRGDSLRRIVLYGLEWKISKATGRWPRIVAWNSWNNEQGLGEEELEE